jgi:hypothetical protein
MENNEQMMSDMDRAFSTRVAIIIIIIIIIIIVALSANIRKLLR